MLLAEILNTEILSCDARQFYREIRIGTFAPNKQILENIQHHFIGNLTIWYSYSAGDYQKDALKKLNELFTRLPIILMVGGSGLYAKVISSGIDYLPFIAKEISKDLFIKKKWKEELKKKYVELNNYHRFLRSLGVIRYSNRSFSSYHKKTTKSYNYSIMKVGLNISRDILFKRLNQRIVSMMKFGFLEEAQECYYFRHLNALQTIAYSDIFNYFDGKISFEKAIEEIKKNTKRYAKRQLTWYKKENKMQWFFSYKKNELIEYVKKKLASIKDKMS